MRVVATDGRPPAEPGTEAPLAPAWPELVELSWLLHPLKAQQISRTTATRPQHAVLHGIFLSPLVRKTTTSTRSRRGPSVMVRCERFASARRRPCGERFKAHPFRHASHLPPPGRGYLLGGPSLHASGTSLRQLDRD